MIEVFADGVPDARGGNPSWTMVQSDGVPLSGPSMILHILSASLSVLTRMNVSRESPTKRSDQTISDNSRN